VAVHQGSWLGRSLALPVIDGAGTSNLIRLVK
jgi:hypothetical protein